MNFKIARYRKHTHTEPDIFELTWEEITALLEKPVVAGCTLADGTTRCAGKSCPHKYGETWSPVRIEGRRLDANVRAVTLAVLDFDGLTIDQVVQLNETLAPYTYIIHGTHNDTPDRRSLRGILPLSREVAPGEWRTVLKNIVADLGLPADPQCKDLSRQYFLPVKRGDVEYLFATNTGQALDVDSYTATSLGAISSNLVSDKQIPTAFRNVDYTGLFQQRLAKKKREAFNPEIVAAMERVLTWEPLADDNYRDERLKDVAKQAVWSWPLETPPEVFVEFVRVSLGKMDSERSLDEWLSLAAYKFTYQQAQRRQFEADLEVKAVAAEELRQVMLRAFDSGAEPEDPDAWKASLPLRYDRNLKREVYESDTESVVTVLEHDPQVKGTLRWNVVRQRIVIVGGPFAKFPLESLPTEVNLWFKRNYSQKHATKTYAELLAAVARRHPYDPLADYVRGLSWDGTPRIDSAFHTYCGVEDPTPEDGHIRRISARWFTAAIARALDPGCKMDNVLILEGRQGIKKSTFFDVLGGPFFKDASLNLKDKDALMMATASWVIELAELASFKSANTEDLRKFITTRIDSYRPPYAADLGDYPRRCVLVGTTNERNYLRDAKGNRRFWPIKVTKIDIDALKRDRDQLWAEAVVRYQAGEDWWLDEDEEAIAATHADKRSIEQQEDTFALKIDAWYRSMEVPARPVEVTMSDVAERALGIPIERLYKVSHSIAEAFESLGFTRRKQGHRFWVAPDYLIKAPKTAQRHLVSVS